MRTESIWWVQAMLISGTALYQLQTTESLSKTPCGRAVILQCAILKLLTAKSFRAQIQLKSARKQRMISRMC